MKNQSDKNWEAEGDQMTCKTARERERKISKNRVSNMKSVNTVHIPTSTRGNQLIQQTSKYKLIFQCVSSTISIRYSQHKFIPH